MTEKRDIERFVYSGNIKTDSKCITEISLADLIAPADTLTITYCKLDGRDCIRLRWWEKILNLFKLIDVEPRFSVYLTSDRGLFSKYSFFSGQLYYDSNNELRFCALELLKPKMMVTNASNRIIEPRIEIEGYLSSSITEDRKDVGGET